uniref:Uncharacterized protein n=1 Tax=Amphimedon queenslandica TaxID=400682 RepID=A0A1X7VVK8_AMPQE
MDRKWYMKCYQLLRQIRRRFKRLWLLYQSFLVQMLLNVRILLNGFLAMKLLLIFMMRLLVMEHVSSEHYQMPLLLLKQIIM